MNNPKLGHLPLRNRFGRRLLLLFLVCSLLPVATLAFVSFGTVTEQLREASYERLQHDGQTLAGALSERLRVLNNDLGQVAPRTTRCTAADIEGMACDGSLVYGLGSLVFVPERGAALRFFGKADPLPPIDPTTRAALDTGSSVLVTVRTGDSSVVYLIRNAGGVSTQHGLLIGVIDADYLWDGSGQNALIPTRELHVLGNWDRVLYGTAPVQANLPVPIHADSAATSGRFEWPLAHTPYLAAYTRLRAPVGMVIPRWTIVLSENRASAEAPMDKFRHTFPIVALLSLGVAFLLGLSQLRRNLAPLTALQEGTRRLANHQFDQPVTVSSGDEFSELADSFNAMSDQIARHFRSLVTAAETDRAVLSSVDIDRIVQAVLIRMRHICHCERVAMLLLGSSDESGGNSATRYTQAADGIGDAAPVSIILSLAEVEQLRSSPEGLTLEGGLIPAYLDSLREGVSGSVVIFPLIFQAELLGAVALGARGAVGRGTEELMQAQRVAGQVALAVANARMVDQIRNLAFFDSLTGLPNRLSFRRRIKEELDLSQQGGRMLAVCFIDLDHFSRINDTLGHKFGDRLVQEVAIRVSQCCAVASPTAEVARLGGDEFTLLLPDPAGLLAVTHLVQQVLDSFNTSFALDGHEVFISASIGVAMYPADGNDVEDLLKNADVAMYQAKRNGRGTYQVFASSMGATADQRLALEGQLRKAIDAGQFSLWYQPLVDVATGQIAGAEALIRWHHPERGMVFPGEFIDLCEETGLILPIGEWVLRTACAQNRQWQREGLPPIPVAINLSGQQLRGAGIVDLVAGILAESGLDPRFVELELTESTLMSDSGGGHEALAALAGLGVGLAIDDFGTGYSSLSYLKHFPVTTLKIDRSFIREVTSKPHDAAITAAIVAMGQALGLRIVAEGVETAAQFALLRQQGCNVVQGNWFSRPIPAEDFAALLKKSGPPLRRRTTELGDSHVEMPISSQPSA